MNQQPKDFTEQAKEALNFSQQIAKQMHHQQWDVDHVLMALLQQEKGVVNELLKEMKIDVKIIKNCKSTAITKLIIISIFSACSVHRNIIRMTFNLYCSAGISLQNFSNFIKYRPCFRF